MKSDPLHIALAPFQLVLWAITVAGTAVFTVTVLSLISLTGLWFTITHTKQRPAEPESASTSTPQSERPIGN